MECIRCQEDEQGDSGVQEVTTDNMKFKHNPPLPRTDWICQVQLAELLGVSEHTASNWARADKLKRFEHGMPNCGRRKYSRSLVERELSCRWQAAIEYQDNTMENNDTSDSNS